MPFNLKPPHKLKEEQRLKLQEMVNSLFPDMFIVVVNGYFLFQKDQSMQAWRERESIHWYQMCLTWLPLMLFKRLSPEDDDNEYESWYGDFLELVLKENKHPVEILLQKYKWQ